MFPRPSQWFSLLAAFTVASVVGGCFKPLYGDHDSFEGASVVDKLRAVEVDVVKTSGPDRLRRVGGELRNETIFALTGGAAGSSDYHLTISLSGGLSTIFSNVNTGRVTGQSYTVTASYVLKEMSTGKELVRGVASSSASTDLPGLQYFAGNRAIRDVENRTAKAISENIRNRLATYFYSGT